MQAKDLEALLKQEIPIAQAMGIKNFHLTNDRMSFQLPLSPNINHKGTLFGGSLYSACALGCYALFLYELRNANVHTNNIVISEGGIQYMAPVSEDAKVVATWKTPEERDQFFQVLKLKRKARVQMQGEIWSKDRICAEFIGTFVAFLEN